MLKVNYRTTQQIRQFADRLFAVGEVDADGDGVARDAVSILNGPSPHLSECLKIDDEIVALAEWLQALGKEDVKAGEIAIFVAR